MSITNHIEAIKNKIFSDLDKNKNTIFDSLVVNYPKNRIPESLFVNYFLPHFIGNITNQNWVVEWISIAGSPMAEVIVFKDLTNEDLFLVPPLMSSNNLLLASENGSMTDIFARYEQINNNLPMSGLTFLINALGEKNKELLGNFSTNDVITKWYDILSRYDVVQKNSDKQTNNTTVDDFFEY